MLVNQRLVCGWGVCVWGGYTSKNLHIQSIAFIRGGQLDQRETEMMGVRWNHFKLYKQIARDAQREVAACAKCFARLILN